MITAAACLVGLHLATYHFERKEDFNEINPGAYVECDGWTAGHYRNSERSDSTYAGYTFHYGRFAITTGVITGYKAGTMPMVIPSVSVTKNVRIAFLPPVPKATINTMGIHLMIEH